MRMMRYLTGKHSRHRQPNNQRPPKCGLFLGEFMKPFDLQEALNGAPIKLRNGNKAFITFNLSNLKDWSKVTDRPLIGYSLNKSESLEDLHSWTLCGWSMGGSNLFDIVGMWEEPELTSEQVLEKAYQEGLRVRLDDGFEYPVIGKARGGSYLLGDERNTYIMWCEDFGKPEIYQEDTAESSPKSDTITVTLPKPFKPKPNDKFWFIDKVGGHLQVSHKIKSNHALTGDGNYFRTKSDAQVWLDAIANASDD